MTLSAPTERQILGAKVRAEAEKYKAKHRKKVPGGWEFPVGYDERRNAHLARKFDLPVHEIPYFMTWSRSCTHPWSEGACHLCPD